MRLLSHVKTLFFIGRQMEQGRPLPVSTGMTAALKSAGVIPARREAGGWKLLLLRAYTDWDFPKGMIETGEDPLWAAMREAREETGIDDFDLEFGDTWCDTPPYSGGKITRYYVAVTKQANIELPVTPELGRPEHNEWRWVDVEEAARLVRARLQPVLSWARERLGAG